MTAPDDKAASALAEKFDVRFVPFGNIYNTLSDVVVIADPQLEVGGGKTEFNPSYLIPRMTVCDVTEMPFDSIYVKQARERGAKVVEPKAIYMNQMSALVKSITGKTVESSEFESVVDAAL